MTQGLAKYHARAPRYILNTLDENLIRVAGPSQVPWEEGTRIINVSLTGLAFTAPEDLCPLLGEVIKIQFQAPGGKQTACFAIVTRLSETNSSNEMLVGVHFYKMEMAHRIALAQGISLKFKDQNRAKPFDMGYDPNASFVHLPQIFIMGCLLYVWLAFTYGFFSWGFSGWTRGLAQVFGQFF